MKKENTSKQSNQPSTGIKIVRRIDSLVDVVLLLFFLVFLLFGLYAYVDSTRIYTAAESSQFETYKPTSEESYSFDELKEINTDVFGWITVYGTHVDYPILQTEDNDKYVNTSVFNKYSLVGSIFLDYRNAQDFSDFNSIIYGHHMDENAMFGELGRFSSKSYFDSHKYGSIYYGGREHGLELFAFLEADAYNFGLFTPGIVGESRQTNYLELLKSNAIHYRDIDLTINDRIVLLYTCESNTTNGRQVVVARITDEVYENTFIEDEENRQLIDLDGFRRWLGNLPFIVIIFLIILILILIEIMFKLLTDKSKGGRNHDDKKTL